MTVKRPVSCPQCHAAAHEPHFLDCPVVTGLSKGGATTTTSRVGWRNDDG